MSLIYIDLARAKSEALFNIYRFLKENIKLSNTKDKLKATRTVKTTTIDLISKKQLCTCRTLFFTFLFPCFARLKRETSFSFLFTRFMEEMFVFLFTLFFHCRSFFTLVAASISHLLTAAI